MSDDYEEHLMNLYKWLDNEKKENEKLKEKNNELKKENERLNSIIQKLIKPINHLKQCGICMFYHYENLDAAINYCENECPNRKKQEMTA